jgi:protein TonB
VDPRAPGRELPSETAKQADRTDRRPPVPQPDDRKPPPSQPAPLPVRPAVRSAPVEPPRLIGDLLPRYPVTARNLQREATISVRVLVDKKGRVEKAELMGQERAGFGFDEAALLAVKRSRFRPATRNGKPITAWTILDIQFRLR